VRVNRCGHTDGRDAPLLRIKTRAPVCAGCRGQLRLPQHVPATRWPPLLWAQELQVCAVVSGMISHGPLQLALHYSDSSALTVWQITRRNSSLSDLRRHHRKCTASTGARSCHGCPEERPNWDQKLLKCGGCPAQSLLQAGHRKARVRWRLVSNRMMCAHDVCAAPTGDATFLQSQAPGAGADSSRSRRTETSLFNSASAQEVFIAAAAWLRACLRSRGS
jgi:hypothetical protein